MWIWKFRHNGSNLFSEQLIQLRGGVYLFFQANSVSLAILSSIIVDKTVWGIKMPYIKLYLQTRQEASIQLDFSPPPPRSLPDCLLNEWCLHQRSSVIWTVSKKLDKKYYRPVAIDHFTVLRYHSQRFIELRADARRAISLCRYKLVIIQDTEIVAST